MAEAPQDRIVLLFCHGASFNKACWNPIIRRLQESPLLKRVSCEVASFNWRFHGDKKDRSVEAKIHYHNGDLNCPRVDHPLSNFPEWAVPALEEEIDKLRAEDAKLKRRTRVIGIGHSMGATTFLKLETSKPGTLDGIVSFDAGFDDGSGSTTEDMKNAGRDYMVRTCLARQEEWDTWEDLLQYFTTSTVYRRWDREVVAAFLKEGVEKTDDGSRWRLVVPRAVEASLYSTDFMALGVEDFARAKCKIVLEHAERTIFFLDDLVEKIAQRLQGQLIVADVIPNTTHSMVLEQPAQCAQHILEALEQFPVFQQSLMRPEAKL